MTYSVPTGICLVVERDSIITAKEVASVDHLSGGRFEFSASTPAGTARRCATTATIRLQQAMATDDDLRARGPEL
jgi:alkanesulfonate monooxygenase SsuD/methylene tetrahydromethanopterin reductase-like flavin-dependent oxidoreductase (luciferase family)